MSTKTAILVRVSTQNQSNDRQRHELLEEARKREWEVVEVVEEKISGRADEDDREGLERIRDLVAKRKIQKVMVHEISRIGRKSSVVHKFIEDLTDAKVSLYWHAQNMETFLPNGKPNAVAGFLMALLAEMGKAEVEQLSERVKSGLAEAVRQGKTLGRPKGEVPAEKFLAKHEAALAVIRKYPGSSLVELEKLTGKSKPTVIKLRKMLASA